VIDIGVALRRVIRALIAADADHLVQWRDCVEIAATCDLDVEHLHHWADVLGVSDDLAELLDGT
jgi:hypothetical protein